MVLIKPTVIINQWGGMKKYYLLMKRKPNWTQNVGRLMECICNQSLGEKCPG